MAASVYNLGNDKIAVYRMKAVIFFLICKIYDGMRILLCCRASYPYIHGEKCV